MITGTTHETCTIILGKSFAENTLMNRVRGEYREMPGMRLTLDQAMRLWTLDRQLCSNVFNSLVATHFLELDESGRYARARSRH